MLFEENENEDEVEFDLALNLIPFFLDLNVFEKANTCNDFEQLVVLKNRTLIYIETGNFRI
ncbi:MAG: hypothetical protein ACK50A_15935 [Sphingobacteriaceae bacterium]